MSTLKMVLHVEKICKENICGGVSLLSNHFFAVHSNLDEKITSNKRKVTSIEQKVTNNEQKITSNVRKATSNEQKVQPHTGLNGLVNSFS